MGACFPTTILEVLMKTFSFSGKAFAVSLLVAASFAFINCDDSKTTTPSTPSLYARLGGTPAISAVVDTFLTRVLADSVIKGRFNTLPPDHVTHLRQELIDQIGNATGGPVAYTGKTMPEAHAHMNIQHNEFAALVGDLVSALNALHVPQQEQTELLNILGPLESQITNK